MIFDPSAIDVLRRNAAGAARFLISTHIHPDPDAIGSALAAREILIQLGASPEIVLQDNVPERCRMLADADRIQVFPQLAIREKFHAVLIVDAGSLARIGDVQSLISDEAMIFNIDHHLSNDLFGAVNFVDLQSSATSELLFLLCREMGLAVTPSMANHLYAGLVTDTGRFRHSNTTSRVFQIASELVNAGADVNHITNAMYFDIPAVDVLSIGAIYSTLELFENGKISTVFARFEHLVEDPDSIVEIALSIRGVSVAALLMETTEGKIRVSMRSRHRVNVAAIAESLGGGGHERAAGFRMKGTLESVRERLLPILQSVVRNSEQSPS